MKSWTDLFVTPAEESAGDDDATRPVSKVGAGSSVQLKDLGGEEAERQLRAAVFAGDTPFAKFQKIFTALTTKVPDEAQRLSIALTTAEATGIKPGDIVAAIKGHEEVLEREVTEFAALAENRTREAVEGPRALAGELEGRIRELEAEITKIRGDKDTKEREAGDAEKAIAAARASFDAAKGAVSRELAAVEAKISSAS